MLDVDDGIVADKHVFGVAEIDGIKRFQGPRMQIVNVYAVVDPVKRHRINKQRIGFPATFYGTVPRPIAEFE